MSESVGTLSVDADRCTGHGRCYSVAPDLLSDDEEGFVTLRGSSMEITAEQLTDAEEAVAACPERAISFTRSS
jgi:ferredoxin